MPGDYSPTAVEEHPLPPMFRGHLTDEHHDVVATLRTYEARDGWSEGVLRRLDEHEWHLRPPGQPADGEVAAALDLVGWHHVYREDVAAHRQRGAQGNLGEPGDLHHRHDDYRRGTVWAWRAAVHAEFEVSAATPAATDTATLST